MQNHHNPYGNPNQPGNGQGGQAANPFGAMMIAGSQGNNNPSMGNDAMYGGQHPASNPFGAALIAGQNGNNQQN